MFKRILTVTLAGILFFEAPAGAYAADQRKEMLAAEETDAGDAGSGPIVGQDDSTVSENDDRGADENDGISGAGNEGETGGRDGGTISGNDDCGEDENIDGAKEGGSVSENDAADSSVSENGSSVSGNDSSISENTMVSVSEVVTATAADAGVTGISYEEAKGNGVILHASAGKDNAAWYSFTAPKAGRYAFYTDSSECEGTGLIYVNLCATMDPDTKNHNTYFEPGETSLRVFQYLWVSTDYMEQGEQVYLQTYVNKSEGEGRSYTVKVADQTETPADENGARSLVMENGDTITLKTKAGCERLRFEAEVTYADTNSTMLYFVRPYWGPADHSAGDLNTGKYWVDSDSTITLGDGRYSGELMAEKLSSGTAYDVSYMILGSSEKGRRTVQFQKLLSGTACATVDRKDGDWLYIHDQAVDEHSVTIEAEPLNRQGAGDRDIYCYYAPTDGSEAEKSVIIDQWKRYAFTGLRSGTEYRFEFRTSTWSAPVKALTLTTLGTPVEINVWDYKAVVNDNFSNLSVSARTDYAGSGKVRLCCDFEDEIQSYSWRRDAKQEDTGGQGFLISCGQWYFTDIMFLPGKTYEMKVWAEFPDEGIAMEPQAITFRTPEKALCAEEEVALHVTQDGEVKTKVRCEVDLPQVDNLLYNSACRVWYRPLGETRYSSESLGTLSSYWVTDEDDGTKRKFFKGEPVIEKLQPNAEYEFLLYLGGVLKRFRLNLNETGISLARVEDAESDHVGPYEFVRTYQLSAAQGGLAGDYYVQLQHIRVGNSAYDSIGQAVPVNEAAGYRLTYSTAKESTMWRVPGAAYRLRWLVGREQNVTLDNAVCCLYEDVTMSPASPLTIGETGYMQYQVTMDAEDVAALKTHNRSREFSCYIRKQGAAEYVKWPKNLQFNAGNNYSVTLSGMELAPGCSYEMFLGSSEDLKYAEGVFNVGEDGQTLKIDSVDVTVNTVTFHYTIESANPDRLPRIFLYTRREGSTVWSRSDVGGNEKGKIGLDGLLAGTAYEYRIGMGSSNAAMEELRSPQDGTFTTKADTKKIEVASVTPGRTRVFLACVLSGLEETGEEDIWRYVHCFYRPVTEDEDKPKWESGSHVLIDGKTSVTCKISGLREETAYEYLIGYGRYSGSTAKELVCAEEGIFTTTADLRSAAVTVTPGMHKAKIDCVYDHVEDSSWIALFVREDSAGAEWQKAGVKVVSEYKNGSVVSFAADGLKANTAYLYKAGFGDNEDMEPEALANASEGTFVTLRDTRVVKAEAEAKIVTAKIAYTLTGMEEADEGYLCGFIRETTEDAAAGGDALWSLKCAEPVDNRSTGGTLTVMELRGDTAYELLIGFGDRPDCGANLLERTQKVTFRTLEDPRKLSDAKAEVKAASAVLSVFFTGNMEPAPSYVSFFYRAKGEKTYHKAKYITNVSAVETGTCSVTLTGLKMGTAYEFTAVLSDKMDEVKDPDSVRRADWKASGEFEMPQAVAPDSLKLSQGKLCLNAGEIYQEQRGYGYEDLKLTWSPANSTKDFLWESSDPMVAAVSADGRVSAVAPGTAQITVTSLYNPEAADSCQVVVGKYRVGYADGTGMVRLSDEAAVRLVKGQRYSGYGLYDVAAGAPVAVTAAKVSSDNEAVVSWNAGEITAVQTGMAHLMFEATDGVRAVLTVDVQAAAGRGFDIVGFTASSSGYPAVREEEKDKDRVQYTLACKTGLTYTAIGEIMPGSGTFPNGDFDWSISDTNVAEVDGNGVVTPKTAGKAVLSVKPKETEEEGAPYLNKTCEVTLFVKELPSEQLADATPVYALANISGKIGDVRMPKEEAWEGWRWEEPNTPLIINGVNRSSYPFRAVYTGETYYPEEKTINVFIAKLTGVSVKENADPGHNHVMETAGMDEKGNPDQTSDRLTLTVASVGYGAVNFAEETNYFYDMDITAPAGLIVEKGEIRTENGMPSREFTVTALRPGAYTVTAAVRVKDQNNSNEKIMAKTVYKVKAVAGKLAHVTLEPVPAGGIAIEDGRVFTDSAADIKTFQVRAELTDINGRDQEAFDRLKLSWSTTDGKVVSVKPSKDTRSAEVSVRGEGHAILQAKVKDAAGHTGTLRVEIRNKAPRVSTGKAVVNLAYDYDTEAGRKLAEASAGVVEIVPVYGEPVKEVVLYEEDKKTVCHDLSIIEEEGEASRRLLIRDSETSKAGVYDCRLCVKTAEEDYFYPLQVTVKNEQAKVTVKSNRAANLFYRSEPASVDVSVSKSAARIESVAWEADTAELNHGFSALPTDYAVNDLYKRDKNAVRFYFKQEDIRLTERKIPADAGVFSGRIRVKLEGYKEPNEGVKVTFKWNYKKPVIVTKEASVTLLPTMAEKNTGRFDLFNQTDQKWLYYHSDSHAADNPKYAYSEMSCDHADITFLPNSNELGWRRYTYTGSRTKGSEKLRLTLRNSDWREPLSTVHTVKLAAPTAYLSEKQLTVNTDRIGTAYTEIRLKNAYDAVFACDSVIIEGGSRKAKALLEDDLLEIRQDSSRKDRILVKINRAQTMDRQPVANGTYPYKVTLCYTDAYGNPVKMKPLGLKVKVTDKAVTARVKTSGKLDLTRAANSANNYISLKADFQNIGSSYTLKDYGNIRLLGDYPDYFDLRLLTGRPGEYRLRIKQNEKLKAGQRYKLALRFLVEMEGGDTFTVQSQTFTVTPKQSVPKIKVYDNNQTLYAAADMLKRIYELEVPAERGYQIVRVSGGIDCNKDGKMDIVVTHNMSNAARVGITVSIADRHGVLAGTGQNGRAYTIPVVVELRGRDGISKDVKASIKVTVRR